MAAWLILLHLWSHDDDSLETETDVLAVLFALALVPVMLPLVLWVAVRNDGGDRLTAAWLATVAVLLVVLLGLLQGWWWAAFASTVGGLAALVYVITRALQKIRAEEDTI